MNRIDDIPVRVKRRADRVAVAAVLVAIAATLVLVLGFTTPKDRPVRFVWQEEGVTRCEVYAPNAAPEDCAAYTEKQLSKMRVVQESPPLLGLMPTFPPQK